MTVLIVLPILTLLMFELGLNLNLKDFALLYKRPQAMLVGLFGQLVLLPLVALVLAYSCNLPEVLLLGLVLIALCPGGSSSNIFTLLAKGDVALSVAMTTVSTVVTMFTLPLILKAVMSFSGLSFAEFDLPIGKLLVQNLVLMLLPISLGLLLSRFVPNKAFKINLILSKIAFPCLVLLASIFFIEHYSDIIAYFNDLAFAVIALILMAVTLSSILSRMFKLSSKVRRTIVIEVGMQNAAQAIALASSPFVFNNPTMAMPAIVYALFMNVILLIYIKLVKKQGQGNDIQALA